MLHAACVPHGILLTEYKDGQFYCADPSEYAGTGIIPIEEAWGTRVENSNAYWYVTSQVADVQEEEDLALPQVTVETSVEDLLLPCSSRTWRRRPASSARPCWPAARTTEPWNRPFSAFGAGGVCVWGHAAQDRARAWAPPGYRAAAATF